MEKFCLQIKTILPILSWITTYKIQDAILDGLAGFTVGLAAIPQGIAFAIIAGLPAQVKILFM